MFIPRDKSDGGWFASGDIAREEDGHYYIEGRMKDVIVGESGENVYPDELEDSFTALPGAEHICVTGIAGKGIYDAATLIVYMGENADDAGMVSAMAAEIKRINGLLPIYKKISKAYLSLDALPLANGIKVRRGKVKEAIERRQGRFEEIDIKSGVVKHTTKLKKVSGADGYNSSELTAIMEQVRAIFGDVLDIEPETVGDTDHFIDDLGGRQPFEPRCILESGGDL